MTDFAPDSHPNAPPRSGDPMPTISGPGGTGSGPPGTAIASLATSCAGLCIPFAGVVGIVLGAIGLKAAKRRGAGEGLAIAGIVIGILTTIMMLVLIPLQIGLMLPALSKARDSARELKAATQATQLVYAMEVAAIDAGAVPPRGADFEAFLDGYVTPELWIADFAEGDATVPSFLLHYRDDELDDAESWPTLIILNPQLRGERGRIPVVYFDGAVADQLSAEEIHALLADGETYTPQGQRWRPTR